MYPVPELTFLLTVAFATGAVIPVISDIKTSFSPTVSETVTV